jgi:hypothetical protein
MPLRRWKETLAGRAYLRGSALWVTTLAALILVFIPRAILAGDEYSAPRGEFFIYSGMSSMKIESGATKDIDEYRHLHSQLEKEDAWAYGLGYAGRLHPHFGIELAAEMTAHHYIVYMTDTSVSDDSYEGNVSEIDSRGLFFLRANAIIYILTGRFSPYIKGGGGAYADVNAFTPMVDYGGGLRIVLYKNLFIRLECLISQVNYSGTIQEVDYGELVSGGTGIGVEFEYKYTQKLKFTNSTVGIGVQW